MTLRRLGDGNRENRTVINFHEIAASGECQKDMVMEWGDIIEIPSVDHPVNARWSGLPLEVLKMVSKCLERQVAVTVKGESKTLTLSPQILGGRFSFDATLDATVARSSLLRASSDLRRVKLTRVDPVTKQAQEYTFDLQLEVKPDFWLRDGDKIDVPEKDPNSPSLPVPAPGVRSIPTRTLHVPPQPAIQVPPPAVSVPVPPPTAPTPTTQPLRQIPTKTLRIPPTPTSPATNTRSTTP